MLRTVAEVLTSDQSLSIERQGSLGPETLQETPTAYTEPPVSPASLPGRARRYRRPRHQTSQRTWEAQQLAWLVRELFYKSRRTRTGRPPWAPLRAFTLQAFKLFQRGYAYDDLRLAIEEAATAAWCRAQLPRTLWFFVGWVKRLLMRGPRDDTKRRDWHPDPERRWSLLCEAAATARGEVARASPG
jgi:hypothetical protein